MHSFRLTVVGAALAVLASIAARAESVTLTRTEDRVRVEIDGQLFTEYIFKGAHKPYLYPILAADGTELMRHFPMKREVAGEVSDHPHHRSLWFAHGAVNGVDFWLESNATKGRILTDEVSERSGGGRAEVQAKNRWVGPDEVVHMTDTTTMRFGGSGTVRWIDYQVTLQAPADKPVVFGDTKEGTMAIRLPLWMTPPHSYSQNKQRHQHAGKGTIVNDSGAKNVDAWGKKSKWVDYHAPKDGKVYGVAIFDHPANPRHPTWWHVRDYGLFAANPFGQHDFEPEHKANPKAGDFTIPAGGNATFRWRFYFHEGDEKAAKVAEKYAEYEKAVTAGP